MGKLKNYFIACSYFLSLLFLLTSSTPIFSDFKSGKFFDPSKSINKKEKRNAYSTLVNKSLEKNKSGSIIYKHQFSYHPNEYSLVEYKFINDSFYNGIERVVFTDTTMAFNSAKQRYDQVKENSIRDGSLVFVGKDSIYERFTYAYQNSSPIYMVMVNVSINKENNSFILTKNTFPAFCNEPTNCCYKR